MHRSGQRASPRICRSWGAPHRHRSGVDDRRSGKNLSRMATSDRVVVMSEVGLDYLPSSPDHDMQKANLRAQLDIAKAPPASGRISRTRSGRGHHSTAGGRTCWRTRRRGALFSGGPFVRASDPRSWIPHLAGQTPAAAARTPGRCQMAADGPHSPGNRLVPTAIQGQAG